MKGAIDEPGGQPKHHMISSSPNILRRAGRIVDVGLTRFFGFIAYYVSLRPKLTIVSCIVVALLCGAGIARIKVVTSAEDLYTQQGTQGFKDKDYVEGLYGYGQIPLYIYATANDRNGSNVLNQQSLLALLDLWENLNSVEGTENGTSYNLTSSRVCYRPEGPNTPCDVVSVLDFWNYSRSAIVADSNLGATVSNTSARDQLGRTIAPNQIMGAIVRDGSGNIQSVGAFQVILSLQNNKEGSASDKRDKVTDAWQKAAVPYVRNYQNPNGAYFINSDWAQNDVSSKTITGDISLLIIGYVLLVCYGLVVLAKPHPVESRAYLAYANVGSIVLAVLATYGLCCLCGVAFSLVIQVLALVLLGLGTDDMLVTMAAHEETGRELPDASITDRIVATVSRARRGVIVASLTNFVAFCTGSSSPLPALRDFMIYAAVGIILVLIFQSTFYVACLTLDMRRQRANKLDCLCCITSKAGPTNGCCGRNYNRETPSITQRVIGIWLPAIILHPLGKAAVVAFTVFLLVMGILGAIKVKQNFNDEWFIPSGNWIKTVFDVRGQYFSQYGSTGAIPFAVYTKNLANPPLDYFNYQDELSAVSTSLQNNEYVSSAPAVDSWYLAYVAWLPSSAYSGNVTDKGRPNSSDLFYTSLHDYINSSGSRFVNNIIFSNTSKNVITSTKIQAYFVSLDDSVKQVNAMRSVRKEAENNAPSLNAMAYTFSFLFYEGYAVIAWDTVKEIIIAGSMVFLICLLLLADLVAAICVGLMVVFVDIELVGFLHWAGLAFNSVTSINLLVAIGIAVDYAAFIAFSFMTKTGTRTERSKKALAHFGVAVFNGGFTMFLAILPAAGAQSFIFQTFFKMFAMIVALGLWHGLCALPVLLSFVGSEPFDSAVERAQLAEAAKGPREQSLEGTTTAPQPPSMA